MSHSKTLLSLTYKPTHKEQHLAYYTLIIVHSVFLWLWQK